MKLIKLNVQDRPLHLLQRSSSESYFALREVDVSLLRPNAVFPCDVRPRFAFIPNCNEAAKRAYIRQACRELGIGLPDASRDELELLRHAQCLPARAPKASLIGITDALALLEGFGMVAAARALTHTLAHTMVVDAHGQLAPLCQLATGSEVSAAESCRASQLSEPCDRVRHSGRAEASAFAGGVGWGGPGPVACVAPEHAHMPPCGLLPGSCSPAIGLFPETYVNSEPVRSSDAASTMTQSTYGTYGQSSVEYAVEWGGECGRWSGWSGADPAGDRGGWSAWHACGVPPHKQAQAATADHAITHAPLQALNTVAAPLVNASTGGQDSFAPTLGHCAVSFRVEVPTRRPVPLEQELELAPAVCASACQAEESDTQVQVGGCAPPTAKTSRVPSPPSASLALPTLARFSRLSPSPQQVDVENQVLAERPSLIAQASPHPASRMGSTAGGRADCCEAETERKTAEELEHGHVAGETDENARGRAFGPFSFSCAVGVARLAQEPDLGTDSDMPLSDMGALCPPRSPCPGPPSLPCPGAADTPFPLCLSPCGPSGCNPSGASVHSAASPGPTAAHPVGVETTTTAGTSPRAQLLSCAETCGAAINAAQPISKPLANTIENATQDACAVHAVQASPPHPLDSHVTEATKGDTEGDGKRAPEASVAGPRKRGRGRPAGSLNRPYLGLGGIPPVLGKRARVRAQPPLWAAVLTEERRASAGDIQASSGSAAPRPRAIRSDPREEAWYKLEHRDTGLLRAREHIVGHVHELGAVAGTPEREGPCGMFPYASAAQTKPDQGAGAARPGWLSPCGAGGQRLEYAPYGVPIRREDGQAQVYPTSYSPLSCRGEYYGLFTTAEFASWSPSAPWAPHTPRSWWTDDSDIGGVARAPAQSPLMPLPKQLRHRGMRMRPTGGVPRYIPYHPSTATLPPQPSPTLLAAHALLSPVDQPVDERPSHTPAGAHSSEPTLTRILWNTAVAPGPRAEECPLALGAHAVAALLSPVAPRPPPVSSAEGAEALDEGPRAMADPDLHPAAARGCVPPHAPLFRPRVSLEAREKLSTMHTSLARPSVSGSGRHTHARALRHGGVGSTTGSTGTRRTRDRTRFAGCVFESLVVTDGVVVRRSAGVSPAWRTRGGCESQDVSVAHTPPVPTYSQPVAAVRAGDPQHAARLLWEDEEKTWPHDLGCGG